MLVQKEIERMIVGGELGAGAKLSENAIAVQLGVSRGPVREALRMLEPTGLVRVEKNRGVFVRQISLEEADEIYEVRAALEGLIGRLAARRIRPEQVEKIRAVVKKMHTVGRTRDAAAYYPLNVQFHALLVDAAGNRALQANYKRVVNELDLYRRETISRSAENIPVSTRDHEAIVNAVAKGDEKLAERLLYEHVIISRERLHKALAKPSVPPAKPARAA
jgi:phosphonate utilization transcriptional regulator